jgi:membrane-associated protease RseP (regulator of RpoE activity)
MLMNHKLAFSLASVMLLGGAAVSYAKPPAPAPTPAPTHSPDVKRQAKVFRYSFDSDGGRLGVAVTSMSADLRAYFGAPADAGLLVSEVPADSPARAAGLKAGDVVVEVAGKKVDDVGDVRLALQGKKEGEQIALGVVRDKKRLEVKTKLAKGNFGVVGFGDGNELDFEELAKLGGAGKDLQVFGRAFGANALEVEALEKKLEELEKRLEKLEKK